MSGENLTGHDNTPKVERVDGYGSPTAGVRAPKAAVFNEGARSIGEIQDAVDQRRARSEQLSRQDRWSGRPSIRSFAGKPSAATLLAAGRPLVWDDVAAASLPASVVAIPEQLNGC